MTDEKNRSLPNKQKLKANQLFRVLVQSTLRVYLHLAYNVKLENLELLQKLEPPYMLLPNHMSFWDPFIINCYIPHTVHYVVSDVHFRYPVKRIFLGLVGAFPKTKFVSDIETVKNILRVKANKGIIGIFPEGRRSWDGHTQPLLYSTAKLIKLLKIPVVVPILKGAFLSLPRWAHGRRKGRVTASFSLGFKSEDLARLKVNEIFEKLGRLLDYDEYDEQRLQMIPFRGKRRAEYMELTLYLCPQCRSIGTLHSHKHDFVCTQCGYAVYYNEYGFLEQKSKVLFFRDIHEWNCWQIEHLEKVLLQRVTDRSKLLIFEDHQVWLYTGNKIEPPRRNRLGRMVLYWDRIEFCALHQDPLIFKIEDIRGINVQDNEKLEFYTGETLYRFSALSRRTSALKWLKAVDMLQKSEDPQMTESPQGAADPLKTDQQKAR